MTGINFDGQYRPMTPRESHILTRGYPTPTHEQQPGLYSRSDIPESTLDTEILAAESEHERLQVAAGQSVVAWQYWVERAWKREHGTFDASARFGAKSYEEHEELHDAWTDIQRDTETPPAVLRHKFKSEVGDLLFSAIALASNSSADLDGGLKRLLYAYVMGRQDIAHGKAQPPPWRPTAAAMATKFGALNIGELDALLNERFEPTISPMYNHFEPEEYDEDSVDLLLRDALVLVMQMRNVADIQYDAAGRNTPWGSLVSAHSYDRYANGMSELVARTVLSLGFIAKIAVDASLSEIVVINVQKVSGRVALNLVDKTDGERPDTLK